MALNGFRDFSFTITGLVASALCLREYTDAAYITFILCTIKCVVKVIPWTFIKGKMT